MSDPRPFGLEDLERQVAIGQVALDPAGELVAYTRRTIVDGRDRIDLWTVPYAGGEPRRLTEGPSSDTTPRFSPDGALIAYLSAPPEKDAQLHVIPRDGGEARRLTSFPHGAGDMAWSPEGGSLIVLADDEHHPGDVVAADGEPTARVIDRIDWRYDEVSDRLLPRHLHRVALGGGEEPERLTAGEWRGERPRVASDGTVLLLADPRPGSDLYPVPQVHRVESDGRIEPVTGLAGGVKLFTPLPDGSLLVLGWPRERRREYEPPELLRVEPGDAVTPLAPGLDRWPGEVGYQTDLHDWRAELDHDGAVTGVSDAGCVVPYAISARGAEPLVDLDALPLAGAIAEAGGAVVASLTLGAGVSAPEVYALEPDGPRRMTNHGSDWLEGIDLPDVEVIDIDGPGGPIQTFLVSPPAAAREPLATVLIPHGGPTDQWGVVPTVEAVLLAAAGYRVALPNIRGSTDRGSAWVEALGGDWGGPDIEDCHAVLDHLVSAGLADPERLGCSGLSYGGFVVNWIIGTSDRFKAAVSENGVVNQIATWAQSDVGPLYNRLRDLGDPTSPEGVEELWRKSPLRHVASLHTPLLMLQASEDLRCPAGDAEQLFVTLRWLGRPVQYVLYPEEHHPFQGDGRFDRRLDRHRRVLEWFGRHMPA
jgi:dipeptidyl aminopeptidase/acylaminoacyl peptidase